MIEREPNRPDRESSPIELMWKDFVSKFRKKPNHFVPEYARKVRPPARMSRARETQRPPGSTRRKLIGGTIATAAGVGLGLIGYDKLVGQVGRDFFEGVINPNYGVIFPYYHDRPGYSVNDVRSDLKLFFVEHSMEEEQYKQTPEQLLTSANLPRELLEKLQKSGTEIVFADVTMRLGTDSFVTDYRNMVMAHKSLLVLLARGVGFFDKSGLYASQNRSGIESYLSDEINGSLARIKQHLDRLNVRDGFKQAISRSGGIVNFCTARLVDPNDLTKNDKSMWLRDTEFEKLLNDRINLSEPQNRRILGS